MPRNPLLFPDNFVLDGASSDSGIEALEIAVNNLSIASKSGAMRQANAIRVSGLNSIKNQNRGMPTLNSLMPTRSVGKYLVSPSEPKGTLGFFPGGWGDPNQPDFYSRYTRVDRFTFATNTLVSLGNVIRNCFHGSTVANATNGYLLWFTEITRLSFQSQLISPIGGSLAPSRFCGSSLRNLSRGYICSGWSAVFGTVYAEVDRFSFAGEVSVSIGSLLQKRVFCSGFGNNFNGYLTAGWNDGNSSLRANNVEKFSYSSESKSNIAAVLSTGKDSMASWMPGSVNATYLMGGQAYGAFPNPNSAVRTYYSNTVNKFVFVGELMSLLGSTLANGVLSFAAIGNATRTVIAGGSRHTDDYTVQGVGDSHSIQMFELVFATEINSVLGSVLSIGRNELNGLDNSSL